MRKTETIKVSSGEDILAYIPHIVGYWPENSVVCIGMRGKALRATLRLDLPPGNLGRADLEHFADVAARQLASDPEADGSLIAIFGTTDWSVPSFFEYRDIYDALHAALGNCGLPVTDAWYVGTAHWRSIECTNPRCCPWPGADNAKINASFINAEFVFRGSAVEDNPRERIPELTAVQDEGLALRVAAAASRLPEGLARSGQCANQLAATLTAWERALQRWPQPPDPATAAYLAVSLGNRCVRDAVMVSFAATEEVSLAGMVGLGLLGPDASEPVVPPSWYGATPCDVAAIALADLSEAAVDAAACRFGDILIGGGDGHGKAAPAPDWARLDSAEDLLLGLSRMLSGPAKAPVLCMLGWIHWCRGRGTWAGCFFQAALRCQPGYELAVLLERLLQSGFIAAWAKDRASAWPGPARERETAA